jgi:hypothetical protein
MTQTTLMAKYGISLSSVKRLLCRLDKTHPTLGT